MKCDVISLENKKVGDLDLDEAIFGAPVRPDLIHRAINWQLAKRRAGTHKTKVISEVSGTSKKPYKQKGTGNARQGSLRSAQFRGGGIIFGPLPRDHAHKMPKKVRKQALRSALSSKQAEGKLVVIDQASVKDGKTAVLAKQMKKLGWTSALVIDGAETDVGFLRAASNLFGIDVLPSQGANVYDIIKKDTLVLTRAGVEKLVERLK
jgi:large subunit ribosomal protein L4